MQNPQNVNPRPVRVSFVTPMLYMSGVVRWIFSLARNWQCCRASTLFVDQNAVVDVATLQEAKRLFDDVIFYDPSKPDDDALGKQVERDAAVIQFGYIPWPNRYGVPTFFIGHDSGDAATRAVYWHANYYGAVSTKALACLPEGERERAKLIYNSVELDRVSPRYGRDLTRSAWGMADKKIALFFGRFEFVKQADDLLRALTYLPPDFVAVLMGQGGAEAELAAIAEAEAPGRVAFVPPAWQIGDALAAADVVAIPSISETGPIVALEAWATGTPVACTDLPSVRELEEIHGLEMAAKYRGGASDLAEAIQRATSGAIDVAAIGQIIWEHYTASRMAALWEQHIISSLTTDYYHARTFQEAKRVGTAAGPHAEP